MIGMSALTGKKISGVDHLKQSIADILNTPIGTRVMRRDYGSRLFELIDQPINRNSLIAIKSAVAEALSRWESRVVVKRVDLIDFNDARIEFDLLVSIKGVEGETLLDGIIVQ